MGSTVETRIVWLITVVGVLLCLASPGWTQGNIISPNAHLPHLGIDGIFTIDTAELSATDPRNPKRVVFKWMEEFSFYQDLAGTAAVAENCRYAYRGGAGDPYYYPERSKRSIWELFELTSGSAACARFKYVVLRAPHGNPIHMHMRFGDATASFEKLLAISNAGPEDKTKLDPWWSVYCAEGVTGCDK